MGRRNCTTPIASTSRGTGRPFTSSSAGCGVLKKHGVEFNTLTVVNRVNSQHPLRVYRYLKEIGSGFIQFIPLVERAALDGSPAGELGLDLAAPPTVGEDRGVRRASPVTDWSVRADDYGTFLRTIFDEWVRRDVGSTFVQLFDVALGNWMGTGGSLCVFSETCGTAMAVEHNGDVYSCDHYVYPAYKLGNLAETALVEMAESPLQRKFGTDKRDTLPRYCRECEVRFACHGECPKHRFTRTPDGEDGLNYLCPAYRGFFNYVDPYMRTMGALLQRNRPCAEIMPMLAAGARRAVATGAVGRNDPCPCGSGRKFKKCCGA